MAKGAQSNNKNFHFTSNNNNFFYGFSLFDFAALASVLGGAFRMFMLWCLICAKLKLYEHISGKLMLGSIYIQ
jgi:hypothetical protein